MRHRGLACTVTLAATVSLAGCISTGTVLDHKPLKDGTPEALANAARREFAASPRNEARARRAFQLMHDAAQATPQKQEQRIPRLVAAARYGIWVARHGKATAARNDHADRCVVICNTVVTEAPERVEGYYYRAVAVGLFARENTVYGPDAMGQIRADARRAIQIEPAFEGAGPHRVLGALYLKAPAPPAGVGSLRRAIRQLQAAVRLAPGQPDNLLFLASAYMEAGREPRKVTELLGRAADLIEAQGDEADRALWRQELARLQTRVRKRAPG